MTDEDYAVTKCNVKHWGLSKFATTRKRLLYIAMNTIGTSSLNKDQANSREIYVHYGAATTI